MNITTCLVLVCISIAIFLAYNIAVWVMFGVPPTLSDTYYLFNNKKKGLGWLFTAMMWIVPMLLMPAALEISDMVSSWSNNFTFLIFFGTAAIMFVGAAPNFRDANLPKAVHVGAAITAAASSLLWCAIVCWKIAYIIPICLLAMGGLAHLTKTTKSGKTYWLEMVAFSATFITILVQTILLM